MSEAEKQFREIGIKLKTEDSRLFGVSCFKSTDKPYISFQSNCMIFKLAGEQHAKALTIKGAELFDPSQKNRPMKEWVSIPFEQSETWETMAIAAKSYVDSLK